MKILLLIAISSIFLTGCVSQSDYDNLKSENDSLKNENDSLKIENGKLTADMAMLSISNNNLENEISSLKTEINNLEASLKEAEQANDEIKEDTVIISPNSSTICHNIYYREDSGTVSYTLDRDEKNRLSLTIYYDLNIETESGDHELKHGMCAGSIIQTFNPYVIETESLYSLNLFTTDHQYDYCNMWVSSSKVLTLISAKERDGTAVSDTPKWINELQSNLTSENSESIIWMGKVTEQIDKEVSVYFEE